MTILDIAAIYRRTINPRARRSASVAIVKATSCRTVFGCVCGAEHSEAASFRVPGHGRMGARRWAQHSRAWAADHKDCMAIALAAHFADTSPGLLAAAPEVP